MYSVLTVKFIYIYMYKSKNVDIKFSAQDMLLDYTFSHLFSTSH